MLMVSLILDADQAFDYLRRVSSECNRKPSVVAADIVRTRQVPNYT